MDLRDDFLREKNEKINPKQKERSNSTDLQSRECELSKKNNKKRGTGETVMYHVFIIISNINNIFLISLHIVSSKIFLIFIISDGLPFIKSNLIRLSEFNFRYTYIMNSNWIVN